MFELLNDDLDRCVEIIRQLSACDNENEQFTILAEERIDITDIEKTVELCQLLCYYYDRMNKRGN